MAIGKMLGCVWGALSLATACRLPGTLRAHGGVPATAGAEVPSFLLMRAMKATGSLKVCVGRPDGEASSAPDEELERMVRDVVADWNLLLQGHPHWPRQGGINLAFAYQRRCQPYPFPPAPEARSFLKIDLFHSHAEFAREVCVPEGLASDDPLCRSSVNEEWGAFWLDGKVTDSRLLSGEVGRMLGVGGLPALADEASRNALWAIATFLETGRLDCAGGMVPVTEIRNSGFRSVRCKPQSRER